MLRTYYCGFRQPATALAERLSTALAARFPVWRFLGPGKEQGRASRSKTPA